MIANIWHKKTPNCATSSQSSYLLLSPVFPVRLAMVNWTAMLGHRLYVRLWRALWSWFRSDPMKLSAVPYHIVEIERVRSITSYTTPLCQGHDKKYIPEKAKIPNYQCSFDSLGFLLFYITLCGSIRCKMPIGGWHFNSHTTIIVFFHLTDSVC